MAKISTPGWLAYARYVFSPLESCAGKMAFIRDDASTICIHNALVLIAPSLYLPHSRFAIYSRLQRDTGGKNILSKNWASYLKARLNCSIPGEFPFYFNEIRKHLYPNCCVKQKNGTHNRRRILGSRSCRLGESRLASIVSLIRFSCSSSHSFDIVFFFPFSSPSPCLASIIRSRAEHVFKHPDDDRRFYAIFSTSMNGLVGSAICTFALDSIQEVFNGKFKEQATSSSAWLPVLTSKVPDPRPGVCGNDTQSLPDSVLNFIRGHPLMDSAVSHDNGKPVFYKRDVVFTRIVVDKLRLDGLNLVVYYAGTSTGLVYKLVEWQDRSGETQSNLVDVFEATVPEPVRAMEISSQHKSLYVSSDSQIRQFDLYMVSSLVRALCGHR